MDALNRIYSSVGTNPYAKTETKKKSETAEKSTAAEKSTQTDSTGRTEYTAGSRVGEPKLSEKAAKYYESLKQKFGNMDFVLVSADMKDTAKSLAGSFARPDKPVVLIDEDKIEKMAEDENYRKKYESIIGGAADQMAGLKNSLASSGADVRGFGMEVKDDGIVSYFAVVNKSLTDVQDKVAEKRAEKKEAEKAAEKKAEKEEAAEKLAEKRAESAENMTEEEAKEILSHFETVSADSIEGLLRKVQEFAQNNLTAKNETKAESYVGKNFDFKL
jgi:hypothetical protein